jgi:hypothetical protein
MGAREPLCTTHHCVSHKAFTILLHPIAAGSGVETLKTELSRGGACPGTTSPPIFFFQPASDQPTPSRFISFAACAGAGSRGCPGLLFSPNNGFHAGEDARRAVRRLWWRRRGAQGKSVFHPCFLWCGITRRDLS